MSNKENVLVRGKSSSKIPIKRIPSIERIPAFFRLTLESRRSPLKSLGQGNLNQQEPGPSGSLKSLGQGNLNQQEPGPSGFNFKDMRLTNQGDKKKLTEELEELRSATKKTETERKKQQQEPDEVIDLSDEDDGMLELSDEDDEDDDDDGVVVADKDPESRATPMHKRKEDIPKDSYHDCQEGPSTSTTAENPMDKLIVGVYRDIDPRRIYQEFDTRHPGVSLESDTRHPGVYRESDTRNPGAYREAQVAAANAELHAMKSTKVKIIRQMREESEKFRKWKADSERALLRLRTEDRKRASAMAKMEALHAKQHNVLKRKMEEAVAVNRRLKEALDRQKVSHLQRNARGVVKADAAQAYIEQQLEMHLSIVDAEISLEELVEDRAMISQQMEKLRNSTDSEDNRRKLAELENDLAMRKAQISDLQQKILTADQENKSHTQWDNIQSMLEAKVALKVIFDMLVEAKRQLQEQSQKGFQSRYQEIKDAYDQLKADYESKKIDYVRTLQAVKTQSEQEFTELVALQRSVTGAGGSEASQHLQNTIRMQQERLDQCEKENKKLTEELEELRSATKKTETERKKQQQEPDEVIDLSDEDDGMLELSDEDDEDDDDDGVVEADKDPESRATPMHKRKEFQKPSRLEMNFRKSDEKYTSSDTFGKRAVKRGSDGSRHCACQRAACASRACGCVKHAHSCGASCRCQPALCRNKLAQGDAADKDNNPSSAGTEPSTITANHIYRPSYFDNAPHRDVMSNVKRKKHYFFGPESNGGT